MIMFLKYYSCLFTVLQIEAISPHLRITERANQTTEKPYMVYILSEASIPSAPICAGSIVSPLSVLTSAACISQEDLKVVFGMSKYGEANGCKDAAKKIVEKLFPNNENTTRLKPDIALVRMDSQFNFQEKAHPDCSYAPQSVLISYGPKRQRPGTDAHVLGWAHNSPSSQPNNEDLKSGSTVIQQKSVCITKYGSADPELEEIIQKYMICADGKGVIDSAGNLDVKESDLADLDGCGPETGHLRVGLAYQKCLESLRSYYYYLRKSRKHKKIPKTDQEMERSDACQIDHGGPLVTWIGGREYLIGVATLFDSKMDCRGPYLFTSTCAHSQFLKSAIEDDLNKDNTFLKRSRFDLDFNDLVRQFGKGHLKVSNLIVN